MQRREIPKHEAIFAELHTSIRAGHLKPGDRLPSEADLGRRHGVSRITVTRALRDLQQAGLVDRRVGAGTFVRDSRRQTGRSFGLLIPDLGQTEIFEPICQGMMRSPAARDHALLWGGATSPETAPGDRAWQLCRQFIERRVSGVFFAPLEVAPDADDVNQRIGRALDEAGIPVVLLDRAIGRYPDPGHHDLVGIDNRHAGYVIADHLLAHGCRRLAFVGLPHAAATVDAREAGYREALYAHGQVVRRDLAQRLDPSDVERIRAMMDAQQPDGIVCANDRTAALVMKALLHLGYNIPADVRLVGVDDLQYAALLPVPLTTLRQPTREIGEAAMVAMLQRIARREVPPRQTRLHGTLIVRESCGSHDDAA